MDDESDAGVETTIEEGSDLEDTGVEDDESLSSGDSEDDTDWKAIAEKEREKAENYKTALDQKRQLRNKPAPPPVVEDEDDEDDKPLTRRELRKVLQEEVAPVVAQNRIDSVLEKEVTDPEKRKLVKLYYETRIRQTGTSDEAIHADIDAALAIADAHKLRKTNEELKRVANQSKTRPTAGSGSDKGPDAKNHKFSEDQVKALTARAQATGADPKKFVEQAWKNQQGR